MYQKIKEILDYCNAQIKEVKEIIEQRADDENISVEDKETLYELDGNPYIDWEDRENHEWDVSRIKAFEEIIKFITKDNLIEKNNSDILEGLPFNPHHYFRMFIEKKTNLVYDEYLDGPNGISFHIYPLEGIHSKLDIDTLKHKIKHDRDVVGTIKCTWVKQHNGDYLYNYETKKED